MEQLPKFVRGKLRSSVNSPHLDPNMLAAFGENALPAAERNFLLQHLSQCFDCRELLALSLPETQPPPVEVRSPRTFKWPVLRWAAAGACVIVVGAAVSLHYENRPATTVAINDGAQLTRQAAAPEKPAADQPKVLADNHPAASTQKISADKKQAPIARRDAAPSMADKDSHLAKLAVEPTNTPATPERSLRAEAAPTVKKEASESKALDEASTGQLASSEPDSSSNEVADMAPGKAKQASEDTLAAKTAPAAPSVFSAPAGLTGNLGQVFTPRWTLANGTLQRSLDGGKTWTASTVGSSANLRALSTLGSEIWVGGTNGALYHSSDAGNHWTQVKPESAGQALAADIIGVEFTDSLHGKLTTSDQHTWTTMDAGQTWENQ